MGYLTSLQKSVEKQMRREISNANMRGEKVDLCKMNELIAHNVMRWESNGYLF
jgi:hypothetical protein